MIKPPLAANAAPRNYQAREVFVHAIELLAPIVAENDSVTRISSFAMARIVQAHFPELSPAETHVVIVAVEIFHRENRLRVIRNIK